MLEWLFGRKEEIKEEDVYTHVGFNGKSYLGEFKKTPWGAKHLPISWYKCPKCGVEFNTSPPSYNALGDMSRVCPDCRENPEWKEEL